MQIRYLIAVLALSACACAAEGPTDPIDGFPLAQQEVIRRDLWRDWPLTVGAGTLGCHDGAVALRSGGTTYGLNEAARARGFSAVEGIVAAEPSAKPSNPLSRVTQEERMKVFEEAAACVDSDDATCADKVRTRHRLSPAELEQINAEGRERVWPPLKRKAASIQPLLERGLALCKQG